MSNYKSKFTGEEVDERLSLAEQIPFKQDKEEGKGLSSNDYSDEDKSLVNTIPNLVTNEQFEEAQTATSESLAEIDETLKAKADIDDYYPDMTVGKSDNLVGRGDVQDATINFRPSGGVPDVGNGMNITDGTARIKAIKGNSVVYNQRLATLFSPSATGNTNTNNGITFTKENDGYFHVSGSNTSGKTAMSNNSLANYEFSIGHKYLFLVDGIQKSVIQAYLLTSQTSHRFSGNGIVTAVADEKAMVRINVSNNVVDVDERVRCAIIDLTQMFGVDNEPKSYAEYLQRKPMNIENEFAYNKGELIDMKADSLVSVGDNAYNPIERKARVIGGQKYHITDSANTEDLEVTFYAFDEDENEEREVEPIVEDGKKYYIFPANGYCIVNGNVGKICVCLEHSYEKPIKPYEVNVKDLSFIKEIATKQGELLFPDGMRSAGSAYDEIRYDVTKKKWVAAKRLDKVVIDSYTNIVKDSNRPNAFTVKYQDLGISSTAKTYDLGAKLNNYSLPNSYSIKNKGVYFTSSQVLVINLGEESGITTVEAFKQKLSSLPFEMVFEIEPIEVEIPNSENWNLDYLVWDFGTELSLVRDSTIGNLIPSAPFRADINYEPNAVDDLRWSIKYIRALEQRVLALEQKVVQETNAELE